MRFCSIGDKGHCKGAVAYDDRVITFSELNAQTGVGLPVQLDVAQVPDISLVREAVSKVSQNPHAGQRRDGVRYSAPFYNPPKLLGIGLNYREHATDLGAEQPAEPASFMKPGTTLIGPNEAIVLPSESKRVTAEAELGVIIGKRCKHVREEDADSVIFGYVPILDMTAEDILLRNPRFLTRAKSFDTFLSFGPMILTPDEVSNLFNLTVRTVLNGEVVKSNQVRNMLFSPSRLIAFFSNVMTFEPGDVISTGTPGAVPIKEGDVVECRIDGFPSLSNHVVGSD